MPRSITGQIALFSINRFSAAIKFAYAEMTTKLRWLKSIPTYFIHLFFILLSSFLLYHPAATAESRLQFELRDNRINLSADKADLQRILQKLNEKTGILIRFPRVLQKTITLELSGVTVEKALLKILKGLNYAIVYSMPADANKVQVSQVHIFSSYKGRARARQSARRIKQIENRIISYEKRIRTAQQRLAQVPQNSAAAKRYQRKIASYQRTVERLERQIR